MKELSYAKVAEMAAGKACPAQGTRYVLFGASAVALAAYSGTPAAGFLLMAVNYRRLGQERFAAVALVLGLLATWLTVVCVLFLPYAVWIPICFGLMVGTRMFAVRVQGELVAQHVSRGGRLGSKWAALGVGVACLGTVLLAVWAAAHVVG
jgi:hypothetical protein